MEEYDRYERFVHEDGRTADLWYGLDSGDFHAWLVAIEPREDVFPDAHSTEARETCFGDVQRGIDQIIAALWAAKSAI